MAGISTPGAIPLLRSERTGGNTLRLTWQGDPAGWILQENATLDPNGWTSGAAGPFFQTTVSSSAPRRLFRLMHP